jgi:lycopene beta-cyclase
MREFDYVIIGGGCAGLSLAYELEIHKKIEDKTLAIIEPRDEYKRDKTWSFWKVKNHNFEDCVKQRWDHFHVNQHKVSNHHCHKLPYQTIDSGLFYKKILNKLKNNKNIEFFKDIKSINTNNSFVFNSVTNIKDFEEDEKNLWQHFYGIEIETENEIRAYKSDFNCYSVQLMDLDNPYPRGVHFYYVLPFEKNKILVETTWISKGGARPQVKYQSEIENYLRFKLYIKQKDYKIVHKEQGAIPLFHPTYVEEENKINIGTAGGMTRLSTGYTFTNIQQHSRFIRKNLENIRNVKKFKINKKYIFFDKIFLKVLEKNPKEMPSIFSGLFRGLTTPIVKFLSGTSNIFEDLIVILQTDKKWLFIKAFFGK